MLFTSNYVNFILYIIVNQLFILFRFYSIELLACPLTGPSSNRKETLFYGEITRMSWIPNCFFCCCDPEKKFLKEQQWSHSMSDFFFSHTQKMITTIIKIIWEMGGEKNPKSLLFWSDFPGEQVWHSSFFFSAIIF